MSSSVGVNHGNLHQRPALKIISNILPSSSKALLSHIMGIIEFELRAQQVEGDLPGTLTFQTTLIKQKQNIYTKDGERFNKRQHYHVQIYI